MKKIIKSIVSFLENLENELEEETPPEPIIEKMNEAPKPPEKEKEPLPDEIDIPWAKIAKVTNLQNYCDEIDKKMKETFYKHRWEERNLFYSLENAENSLKENISQLYKDFEIPSSQEFEILPNKNFTFDAPKLIGSAIQESQNMSSNKSFSLRCVLSTTDEALSPVIDLNRASVHTIQNLVSSNGGSETTATGGAEISRYITKKIELNEEADSATVFLNVNRPGASNVDLYYRTLEGGSSADINDVAFTLASPTEAIPVNEASFSEVKYDLDETVLAAANIGSFGTIQFKIVMRSTSTSNVPKIKDFRAICAT